MWSSRFATPSAWRHKRSSCRGFRSGSGSSDARVPFALRHNVPPNVQVLGPFQAIWTIAGGQIELYKPGYSCIQRTGRGCYSIRARGSFDLQQSATMAVSRRTALARCSVRVRTSLRTIRRIGVVFRRRLAARTTSSQCSTPMATDCRTHGRRRIGSTSTILPTRTRTQTVTDLRTSRNSSLTRTRTIPLAASSLLRLPVTMDSSSCGSSPHPARPTLFNSGTSLVPRLGELCSVSKLRPRRTWLKSAIGSLKAIGAFTG